MSKDSTDAIEANPIYVLTLARINVLMPLDPPLDTAEGQQLRLLADIAEYYETRHR